MGRKGGNRAQEEEGVPWREDLESLTGGCREACKGASRLCSQEIMMSTSPFR